MCGTDIPKVMPLYVQNVDLYGAAVANLPYAQQDVYIDVLAYVFEVSVFQFIYTVILLTSYEYICDKYCTAVPNICGSPICNLLYVTRLILIIGMWFIDFWKIFTAQH